MQEVHRYPRSEVVYSKLNPLEDVMGWVEGLASPKYVKEVLVSNHSYPSLPDVRQRSEIIANFVSVACKYLEQADKGPKEVSFLPLYYACLNIAKAYIAMGPHLADLSQSRRHGASYDANRNFESLESDFICLQENGTIPLFYRTLVGEDMFRRVRPPITLRMRDIYPYIFNVGGEYGMARGSKSRLILFTIGVVDKAEKQRVVAEFIGEDTSAFGKIRTGTLQGFARLRRQTKGRTSLVSKWYAKDDLASLRACLRPAMLYGMVQDRRVNQLVPWSSRKLLLPEELPLICAFFHMSNIVRYNPSGLRKLMDSKYWPVLLALRKHGLYRFLLLFWSFAQQCCTHIMTG